MTKLIKEEIEKQKSFYQRTFDVLHPDDLDATIAYAQIELLDRLLQFIDSLPKEPASKDLIEEIDKIWKTCNPIDEGMGVETANIHIEQFDAIARHFAEWGRNHFEDKSEMVSEDLEEAAQEYSFNIPTQLEADIVWKRETEQYFKNGAEWQKQKDKQLVGATQKISHQHGYDEGRFDMREEMMKDAVEAFVNTYENTDDSNYVEFVTEQSPYKFKETEKCKLIIIKED